MQSQYRRLIVWRKSIDVVKAVYQASSEFPAAERYGLSLQLRRAAVSLPSNIAESQGRFSRKDCVRLLLDARGSLYELETQLVIAEELGYLTMASMTTLKSDIGEVERLLNGLIRFNRKRATKP